MTTKTITPHINKHDQLTCWTCKGSGYEWVHIWNYSRGGADSHETVCSTCRGEGTVTVAFCARCMESGWVADVDAYSEEDSTSGEHCDCEAGQELEREEAAEEAARVDAEAFDAHYAHEAATASQPIEHGMTVALEDKPF